MRFSRLLVIPAAALALTACSPDDGPTVNVRPPLAGVRYIHAVPDGGPITVQMVDQLQWSARGIALTYRTSSATHEATEAKARRIRAFRQSTVITEAETILADTTITFQANVNYTLLLAGSQAANSVHFVVIEDNPPTISEGQIAVRVVNAGMPTAVDAYILPTTAAALTTPTFANVAPLTGSTYQLRATGAFAVRAHATGAPGTIWSAAAPAGAPEANGIGATAGATASRSGLAAYVFPRSVAGSPAPQTAAFNAPAVIFFVDQVPPPPTL